MILYYVSGISSTDAIDNQHGYASNSMKISWKCDHLMTYLNSILSGLKPFFLRQKKGGMVFRIPFFVVKVDLKGWSGRPNETYQLRVGTKVEMTP